MIGATTGCTWCDSNYPAHAIGHDMFHGTGEPCTAGDGDGWKNWQPLTRQAAVLAWAVENFGPIATNPIERAARMVEEAIEVAQAAGLSELLVQRIAMRVYLRPVGMLAQEIGGLAITLDALAENASLDVQREAEREWSRVKSLPKEWWQRKHAEKVTAGVANLSEAA